MNSHHTEPGRLLPPIVVHELYPGVERRRSRLVLLGERRRSRHCSGQHDTLRALLLLVVVNEQNWIFRAGILVCDASNEQLAALLLVVKQRKNVIKQRAPGARIEHQKKDALLRTVNKGSGGFQIGMIC